MAQLAIKGHPTRGSEVITLLEMLGGINKYNICTTKENLFYYLSKDDNVIIDTCFCPITQKVFTLEEFEEKFPYKVGDEVTCYPLSVQISVDAIIIKMYWDGEDVLYITSNAHEVYAKDLQPYKE